MTEPDRGLRARAVVALAWSLLQNWGSRAISSLVFLALAAFLEPADFGIAASAILVAFLLATISDLGLADALVQRPALADRDVTLPLLASFVVAVALAAAVSLAARPIAGAAGLPALAPYLLAAAWTAPVAVAAGIQDALYRRRLAFRILALRTLVAGIAGGAVGFGVAASGHGAAAPLCQLATATAVGAAWLWARPAWRPTAAVDARSFRALLLFGWPIVTLRIVDFAALRAVDAIILSQFGAAALGLYTVASRVYTLLLQLLQAAVASVALSVLSRIAHDPVRLRRAFLRSTSLAASLGTPVFLGGAGVAPEIADIAFGPRWAGTADIMRPLLLLGGVHCVQFVVGPFLTAAGRPELVLRLVLFKAAIVLPVLALVRVPDVTSAGRLYAALLLVETPLAAAYALRTLGLRARDLVRPVVGPLAAALGAYGATELARAGTSPDLGTAGRLPLIACVFAGSYAALLAILARQASSENLRFLRSAWGRPGPDPGES